MLWLTDSIEAIRDFMELGGPVLRWIAFTILVMWVLIIERLIYFRLPMKAMSKDIHDRWESRPERKSWNAHQIREGMISQFSMATNRSIPMIQTLVALCPLLGLMGTVTGMIKTFQVITLFGAGDPKMMAGGISQALMTTVLGLVVAIPMVLIHTLVSGQSRKIINILQSQSAGIVATHSEKHG